MQYFLVIAAWISILALGCALVFGVVFYLLLSRKRCLSIKTTVLPALILWNACSVIAFMDSTVDQQRQGAISRTVHGPEGHFGLVTKSLKWIIWTGPSTGLMVLLLVTRGGKQDALKDSHDTKVEKKHGGDDG